MQSQLEELSIADAESAIKRLREYLGSTTDADVAKALGVDPRNLANFKARGRIPLKYLLAFSRKSGVSMDWLCNGRGPVTVEGKSGLDAAAALYEALNKAGLTVSRQKFASLCEHIVFLQSSGVAIDDDYIAKLIQLIAA